VFQSGTVTANNCVKWVDLSHIADAGKTCGGGAGCTPDGGTVWSNACDLPLLPAIGF